MVSLKKNKKVLPFLAAVIFAAIFTLFPIKASAEAYGSFYIPDGAVPAGSEFNITVEFSASDTIGTVQAAITYNENSLQFVSGRGAFGGGGIVNINDFPDIASDTMTVTLTFKALKEGSSQINMTNGSVITPDGISLSNSITAYAEITVGPAVYGDDSSSEDSEPDSSQGYDDSGDSQTDGLIAVLKSLTIEVGELQPPFSPGIYNYTVKVPHDVDVFELEGETGSLTDTIWYEGSLYLADGKNQRTITVTSADGLTSNTYTITIYRDYAEGEEPEDYEEEYEEELSENSIAAESTANESNINDIRKPSKTVDGKTGMDDLRDSLMPALYVATAVIIVAVVILIFWIRNKTKNKLK